MGYISILEVYLTKMLSLFSRIHTGDKSKYLFGTPIRFMRVFLLYQYM